MYIPYFFQVPEPVKVVESNLLTMGLIIATFAMFVGVYTVTMREISRTRKKVKGWPFSVWMLFVLWFMVVTGVTLGQSHQSFQFFQNSILIPGDATIYSIMLFYMISAGARSFRARDMKSVLLIIVAFFVLMQQAPIGTIIWGGFDPVGSWLGNNLGMAVTRTFNIIVSLSGIVLAIRFLSGKELSILGVRKEVKKSE